MKSATQHVPPSDYRPWREESFPAVRLKTRKKQPRLVHQRPGGLQLEHDRDATKPSVVQSKLSTRRILRRRDTPAERHCGGEMKPSDVLLALLASSPRSRQHLRSAREGARGTAGNRRQVHRVCAAVSNRGRCRRREWPWRKWHRGES